MAFGGGRMAASDNRTVRRYCIEKFRLHDPLGPSDLELVSGSECIREIPPTLCHKYHSWRWQPWRSTEGHSEVRHEHELAKPLDQKPAPQCWRTERPRHTSMITTVNPREYSGPNGTYVIVTGKHFRNDSPVLNAELTSTKCARGQHLQQTYS